MAAMLKYVKFLCVLMLAFFAAMAYSAEIDFASSDIKVGQNPFDQYPIHFAAINDTAIAYQVMGPENGEPVLLIMGLGAQMLHWGDELVQGLLNDGFRVILLDNRDAGLSQKFYDLPVPSAWWMLIEQKLGLTVTSAYTLSDMASDAVGLLDILNIEKANIVGASMGGMIAQVLVAEHPQRVISLTSIMSSSGAPNLPAAEPQALEALVNATKGGESRKQKIEQSIGIVKAIGSPAYFDESFTRAMAERVFNRGSYVPGMLRQFNAIIASGDRTSMLQTIHAPTLVLHGAVDPLVPVAHGRDTADKIAGSRFVSIPDMGHAFGPVLSRLVLAELLPFLRDNKTYLEE